MNKLEKNSVQFDYFSSNYQKFEEDFYEFANLNIPLTFLTDDILKMMFSTGRNYFRLNASNAKDKRDHFFLFKEHGYEDNKGVLRYEYVGHHYNMEI